MGAGDIDRAGVEETRSAPSPAIAVVVVATLLTLAAAAVPGGFALLERRGEGGFSFAGTGVLRSLLSGLAVVAILSGLLGVVLAFRSAARRPRATWERRSVGLLLVVASVGALFVAAGRLAREERAGPAETTPPPSPTAPVDGSPRGAPPIGPALVGIAAAAALGGIAVAFLLLRRAAIAGGGTPGRGMGLPDEGPDPDRIADPRAAVIACYVRMQRLLAAGGVDREPTDTPTELADRVRSARPALEPGARRLTRLYQEARFSDHPLGNRAKRDALTALGDVRERLGAGEGAGGLR